MRRKAGWIGSLLLVAAICFASAGCYKHVVREEGLGADPEVDIYEPNRKPGLFDDPEDESNR